MPAADTPTAAMSTELYLASTPLHILNAIAIASNRPEYAAHLVLIDQPDAQDNPYFKVLSDWPGSPFKSLDIYQGRIKGVRQKLANRKAVFAKLDTLILQLNPQRIYTGNDRRIEFQYAMHAQCKLNKKRAEGVYMDEGTFTYVGRKDSASISDKYIDNFLKKLTYGFWWKNPITIGGSDWINDVYAAFPQHVHALLAGKTVHSLQPLFENNSTVESFCQHLFQFFGETTESIKDLRVILTLPHESIIDSIAGYKESIEQVVQCLVERNIKVGIKYHPRNQNPDVLNAKVKKGVYLLSHRIPFEAVLPNLGHCTIVGDISSTMINSKFLKPDCDVVSIANPSAPLYDAFIAFFKKIDVKTLTPNELIKHLDDSLHRIL